MIKKFDRIDGRCIEKIYGQDRFGYSLSDFTDFYDLIEWAEEGGYQGAEILFYDFDTGQVYRPFDKKRNVVYGAPIYANDFLYFLQGDYDEQKVTLYKYLPEMVPEEVVEFDMSELNLYNLALVGSFPYVISQDSGEKFQCYYPEKISFELQENESVTLIEDGKVYIEKWIEEGWDTEKDCATEEYKYYNKIIIKDFSGNTISEEVGCLNQAANGDWWIS